MTIDPDSFDCLLAWYVLETAGRYLSDTADERAEQEREAREKLGEEHGRSAASWLLDGNSSEEAAEVLLRGILGGDPAILDQHVPCGYPGATWSSRVSRSAQASPSPSPSGLSAAALPGTTAARSQARASVISGP
jgi:hypothetical protein